MEAKLKKFWREVSQLTSEIQRGVIKDKSWMENKYNKMSIGKDLETSKDLQFC